MAIRHRVSASAGSTTLNPSVASTAAVDTTGANFLVVAVAYGRDDSDPYVPVVSDNKSNTWATLTAEYQSDNNKVRLYYAMPGPTNVGTGHTFSVTVVNGAMMSGSPAIAVSAYSGVAPSTPLDQTAGAGANSELSASATVTPTRDGELLVTTVGTLASPTVVRVDSGFTIDATINSGGTHGGVAIAHLIQAPASSATARPSWTMSVQTFLAVAVATLKPQITEPINVRNRPYSATGDGATNDTVAFQDALTAATAAGVPLYVPTGTYKLTSTLTPTTAIYGDGIDFSVLNFAADVDGLTFTFTGPTAFYRPVPTVRDLSVTSSVNNGTKTAVTVNYPDVGSINEITAIIERVSIRPFNHGVDANNPQRWQKGIVLDDCWQARVLNCVIHGPNDNFATTKMDSGIHVTTESYNVDIDHCAIFGVEIAVLCDGAVEGTHITNLLVEGCNYGVFLNTAVQHPWAVVSDCHFTARIAGIVAIRQPQSTFSGNLIYKASNSAQNFTGILLGTASEATTIIGNKIIVVGTPTGTARGIDVTGGDQVTVIGNVSFLCDYCVAFASTTSKCTAVGNTAKNATAPVLNSAGAANVDANNI